MFHMGSCILSSWLPYNPTIFLLFNPYLLLGFKCLRATWRHQWLLKAANTLSLWGFETCPLKYALPKSVALYIIYGKCYKRVSGCNCCHYCYCYCYYCYSQHLNILFQTHAQAINIHFEFPNCHRFSPPRLNS